MWPVKLSISERRIHQIALNSPGVVIADVALNHLNKLLLAGKTPAIIVELLVFFRFVPLLFSHICLYVVGFDGYV